MGDNDNFLWRPSLDDFGCPRQPQIDWLVKRHGVPPIALCRPEPVFRAEGLMANDGYFDLKVGEADWLVFLEPRDVIFWQPRGDELASWTGRSFALGEAMVDSAWTCSFDGCLNIYASPLQWLQASRDGIVIRDWNRCYANLQHVQRIAVEETLVDRLCEAMQPAQMPEILVRRDQRRDAA